MRAASRGAACENFETMETKAAVILKAGEAERVLAGHPWLYQGSVLRLTGTVEDGAIVAQGDRSHLFYVGDGTPFKNFILRVELMTKSGSNGGIYFHTKYQPTGWPSGGFEFQVNNTHTDWKKTGSLYDVVNVAQSAASAARQAAAKSAPSTAPVPSRKTLSSHATSVSRSRTSPSSTAVSTPWL